MSNNTFLLFVLSFCETFSHWVNIIYTALLANKQHVYLKCSEKVRCMRLIKECINLITKKTRYLFISYLLFGNTLFLALVKVSLIKIYQKKSFSYFWLLLQYKFLYIYIYIYDYIYIYICIYIYNRIYIYI